MPTTHSDLKRAQAIAVCITRGAKCRFHSVAKQFSVSLPTLRKWVAEHTDAKGKLKMERVSRKEWKATSKRRRARAAAGGSDQSKRQTLRRAKVEVIVTKTVPHHDSFRPVAGAPGPIAVEMRHDFWAEREPQIAADAKRQADAELDIFVRANHNKPNQKKRAEFHQHALQRARFALVEQITANMTRAARSSVMPSASTIRRDLVAAGRKAVVRPKQTFNRTIHAIKRYEFAVSAINLLRAHNYNILVCSDETFVSTVNDNTCRYQWVHRREDALPRINMDRRCSYHVQVWAAIGVGWRSELVFVESTVEDGKTKRLNADRYKRECLNRVRAALVRNNSVFLQDGARCHIAASVKEWFTKHNIVLLQNAPYSPDLNPIESVWALFKNQLTKFGVATSQDELKEIAVSAWNSISQAHIDRTIRGLETKLEAIVAAGRPVEGYGENKDDDD